MSDFAAPYATQVIYSLLGIPLSEAKRLATLAVEMATLYRDLKADEWARARSAVTDWEDNMYLEYLP